MNLVEQKQNELIKDLAEVAKKHGFLFSEGCANCDEEAVGDPSMVDFLFTFSLKTDEKSWEETEKSS